MFLAATTLCVFLKYFLCDRDLRRNYSLVLYLVVLCSRLLPVESASSLLVAATWQGLGGRWVQLTIQVIVQVLDDDVFSLLLFLTER